MRGRRTARPARRLKDADGVAKSTIWARSLAPLVCPEVGASALVGANEPKSLAITDAWLKENGSPGRIRTYDQSINSRLLYH